MLGRPNAGIADEDVEPAELVERTGEQAIHPGAVGDVAGVGPGGDALALELVQHGPGLVVALVVREADLGAGAREQDRSGAANAARAARHQGALPDQVERQHAQAPIHLPPSDSP